MKSPWMDRSMRRFPSLKTIVKPTKGTGKGVGREGPIDNRLDSMLVPRMARSNLFIGFWVTPNSTVCTNRSSPTSSKKDPTNDAMLSDGLYSSDRSKRSSPDPISCSIDTDTNWLSGPPRKPRISGADVYSKFQLDFDSRGNT